MMKTLMLIESDAGDVRIFKEVFHAVETIDCQLVIESQAEQAMRLLENKVIEVDLVILDLNQIKLDSYHLLQKIKQKLQDKCPYILVVGDSIAEETVQHAHDCGADCYMIKPDSLAKYQEMIGYIESYLTCQAPFPAALNLIHKC